MKTALFKLLNQTVIPHYAAKLQLNYNIKFQDKIPQD